METVQKDKHNVPHESVVDYYEIKEKIEIARLRYNEKLKAYVPMPDDERRRLTKAMYLGAPPQGRPIYQMIIAMMKGRDLGSCVYTSWIAELIYPGEWFVNPLWALKLVYAQMNYINGAEDNFCTIIRSVNMLVEGCKHPGYYSIGRKDEDIEVWKNLRQRIKDQEMAKQNRRKKLDGIMRRDMMAKEAEEQKLLDTGRWPKKIRGKRKKP